MTKWQIILSIVTLITWSFGWGLFFRKQIAAWWEERPKRRVKAMKDAKAAAEKRQKMLDELAAKYPLPPAATDKPAGKA